MATLTERPYAVDLKASRFRLSGLLLIAAAVDFFVTIVVVTMVGLAGRGPTFNRIAEFQQYVISIAAAWIAVWGLSTLAYIFITLGLVVLARVFPATKGRTMFVVGLVAAVIGAALRLFLCYLMIGVLIDAPLVASQPFQGNTVGWIGLQPTADLLMLVAVSATALSLFQAGLLRRTGLIVGSLCGAALLFHLVLMLTVSSALPPIVAPLLALPLGIGLARRPI